MYGGERKIIALISRLAFIESSTLLLHFRLFCAYTIEIFLRSYLDCSVKKRNFVELWNRGG